MLTLQGATLIDGTGSKPVPNSVVTVEGTNILSLERQPGSSDHTTLDLDGLTLLPGMIDVHTHLGVISLEENLPEVGLTSPAELAAQIFRNCELALEAGFTTVRDVGGLDGGIVRAIERGLVRGPRIFPSGPVLCQSGGHATLQPPFSNHYHPFSVPGLLQSVVVADGPDQVRHAAREAFRRGATQLKMAASGGIASRTDRLEDSQFTVEELRAAVVEAEARGTYVSVHAHGAKGIRNGLEAGVASFEHGTEIDAGLAVAMAEAKAAFVPTLTVVHLLKENWRSYGLPEDLLHRVEGVEEGMTDAIRYAYEAGVIVGSGTDLMGAEQSHRATEIVLRAQIRGPMEAIVAATSINAKIMRLHDRLGTIAPGKTADIIAVDGDPLENPQILDDPGRMVLVIKAGTIAKNTVAG